MSRRALAHRQPVTAALCGVALCVTAIAVALSVADASRAAAFALAALQTVLVSLLVAVSWARSREWARVGVMVAATWVLAFLITSWVFAADPSLLDAGSPNRALATVDVSLVCVIAGYVAVLHGLDRRPPPRSTEAYVQVEPVTISPQWAVAWAAIGLLGFAALFAATGGPIHFIKNVSSEGSLTRGRTYFIAAGLAVMWIAQVVACAQWARGRALRRPQIAALIVALLMIAPLGARELLAVPLVELILFYGLVRKRVSLRAGVPLLLAAVFVIVFVIGMVKRYGNYVAEHPGTHIGRIDYLVTKGPGDFFSSYATNTADGVRLVALGESVVPRYAHPEYGKELLRLLLQPLPSGIRPKVATAPAIESTIYPSSQLNYAQPLQLVAYLQFYYPGVVVAFLLLGAAAAAIDHALTSPRRIRPSTLLLLIALATALLTTIRSASAPATADALIEVVGLWLVARSCERPAREIEPDTERRYAATVA